MDLSNEAEMDMGIMRIAKHLGPFYSNLDMDNNQTCVVKKAVERLKKIKGLDSRHKPTSIAATIIYMAGVYTSPHQSYKHVSIATSVSTKTIMKTKKQLTKHAEILFAMEAVRYERHESSDPGS